MPSQSVAQRISRSTIGEGRDGGLGVELPFHRRAPGTGRIGKPRSGAKAPCSGSGEPTGPRVGGPIASLLCERAVHHFRWPEGKSLAAWVSMGQRLRRTDGSSSSKHRAAVCVLSLDPPTPPQPPSPQPARDNRQRDRPLRRGALYLLTFLPRGRSELLGRAGPRVARGLAACRG